MGLFKKIMAALFCACMACALFTACDDDDDDDGGGSRERLPSDETEFTVSGDPITFNVTTKSEGDPDEVVLTLNYGRTGKGADDLITMSSINLRVDVQDSNGASKSGFPKKIDELVDVRMGVSGMENRKGFALDPYGGYFDDDGKVHQSDGAPRKEAVLAEYNVRPSLGVSLEEGDKVIVQLVSANITRPEGSSLDFRDMTVAVIDTTQNAGGIPNSFYAELGKTTVGGESVSYAPLISETKWEIEDDDDDDDDGGISAVLPLDGTVVKTFKSPTTAFKEGAATSFTITCAKNGSSKYWKLDQTISRDGMTSEVSVLKGTYTGDVTQDTSASNQVIATSTHGADFNDDGTNAHWISFDEVEDFESPAPMTITIQNGEIKNWDDFFFFGDGDE